MSTNSIDCIKIDHGSQPIEYSVIWLHGLGADGHDFVPIVSELRLPKELSVRFIFPHAPVMPVSVNNGYEMRAWYDITSLSIDRQVDRTGIVRSVAAVELLIESEIESGVPAQHIFLAGFSQGAVIALNTGLKTTKRLAGIIALSGYLPFADEAIAAANPVNRDTPIYIAHGTQDPIVPFVLGETAATELQAAGYAVSWHSYPMAHSVCPTEIADISAWIQKYCGGM
jgi:phospholipase/carboxylesterase